MVGLRKSSNNRNNKENEFREAGSMAEAQAFPSKDPAVRKVSDKLGARLRVGPVGEVLLGQIRMGCQENKPTLSATERGWGSEGQGALCLSAPSLK